MSANDWQPTATRTMLKRRARILARIRRFMRRRGILEVETPILNQGGNPDPNLLSLETQVNFPFSVEPRRYYLHTSPEFCMKRLLAAGSGPIYQITRVFRDQEAGRLHQPEFTMLEWYRPGSDHLALMEEVDALLQTLDLAGSARVAYAEAFRRYTGLNPHACAVRELQNQAAALGLDARRADRSMLLDAVFSHAVAPNLGMERPQLIYDFPACQAALARIRKDEITVAERFELFINGMEIANGYHELCDGEEVADRFERENASRRERGLAPVAVDEHFLAALRHGLPGCAGVAVGLDRLILAMIGGRDLMDVLTFPISDRC